MTKSHLLQRKDLIKHFNDKKMPTYSTLGKEDVELGVLLGSGAYDLDKKLAEATSFNIKGALHGQVKQNDKVKFYEDEVFYINADTAKMIGYQPHLRIMNNAEIISHQAPKMYDLSTIFSLLEKQNLDIERKRLLVKAARRAAVSAALRYLPTLRIDLGHQTYNKDYAMSYSGTPTRVGQFVLGLDQVIGIAFPSVI